LSTKTNWLRISSADECHLAHIKGAYFHTCHAWTILTETFACLYIWSGHYARKVASWRLFDHENGKHEFVSWNMIRMYRIALHIYKKLISMRSYIFKYKL
jgi:hypothetical protein